MTSGTLAGRTIVMSGGRRGIGLAVALRAAQDVADVVIEPELAALVPAGAEQSNTSRTLAERTRHAAEAVQPVVGRPARRYAAAVAELQETLGDFQDGVVTRQVLRELGARGHRSGENGVTFGRLHALEQVRAEAAVDRWPQARTAVSRPRLRRWLDR